VNDTEECPAQVATPLSADLSSPIPVRVLGVAPGLFVREAPRTRTVAAGFGE
jgi:hypothetical protein